MSAISVVSQNNILCIVSIKISGVRTLISLDLYFRARVLDSVL